jgi:hypothetical protein
VPHWSILFGVAQIVGHAEKWDIRKSAITAEAFAA